MPIKTILVALALDDDSQRVADRAVQLADQHNAQLVGVHVIENLPLGDPGLPASANTDALVNMLEAQCVTQLQAQLERAKLLPITYVEAGKPHDVLSRLMASYRADLLVIGPGVAKGVREKVFGSTADRVVRSAPCPVLVVRQEADGPYRHIAVGVDLSPYAQAAVAWAKGVSPDALRELIHAFEIPLAFEQAMLKAGTSQADIDHYRRVKSKTTQQQLMHALSDQGGLTKAERVRMVRGDAASILVRASRRKKTDLIALGTQGAHAMSQHMLGSVARRVLAEARCDVLVIPATATQLLGVAKP